MSNKTTTIYLQRIFNLFVISFILITCFHFSLMAEISQPPSSGNEEIITLTQGIEMVLRDSRLIKIELAGKDMSFEDTLIALSELLPHLNVNASKTFNRYQSTIKFGSQTIPVSDREPISWGVSVYQTLFDFGKSISNYQASNKTLFAQKAKVESVKRIVSLEFITAYFELLEAQKMIKVCEREVESLTSYLNDMQHLYEQGVIVKNDLLPAEVKLADAKQQLIAARNKFSIQSARLKTILAMPLKRKIKVKDVRQSSFRLATLEDSWQTARKFRPEIKFYDNQIKASELFERAQKAKNFPNIFVGGGYNYTSDSFQVNQDNAYVQLGVKLDLYDGGKALAGARRERDLRKQLTEQKNKIIEDIDYEIEDSFLSLKNAYKKLGVAKNTLEQAQENVRVNRVKYNNGVATSTDVLAAISLETTAQTNYYTANYEVAKFYARFIYAVGSDLKSTYQKMEEKSDGAAKK
jgi:outer membrane protein TolC